MPAHSFLGQSSILTFALGLLLLADPATSSVALSASEISGDRIEIDDRGMVSVDGGEPFPLPNSESIVLETAEVQPVANLFHSYDSFATISAPGGEEVPFSSAGLAVSGGSITGEIDGVLAGPSQIVMPTSGLALTGGAGITGVPSAEARTEVTESAARSMLGGLAHRATSRFGASETDDSASTALADDSASTLLADDSASYLRNEPNPARRFADNFGEAARGWSGFVSGAFERGDASPVSGSSAGWDFDLETNGALLGFDYLEPDRWLAGAAFGYMNSDADSQVNNAGIENEMWIAGLYGSLYPAPEALPALRLSANAIYGWGNGTETRWSSNVPTPEDDIDSRAMAADFTASYEIDWRRLNFVPEAGFAFVRSEFGGENIDQDLRAKSHYAERGTTFLGLNLGADLPMHWGKLRPTTHARWLHVVHQRDDDFVLESTTSSLELTVSDKDDDYYVVGGGLVYEFGRHFQAQATVDQILGHSELDATSFSAGLIARF